MLNKNILIAMLTFIMTMSATVFADSITINDIDKSSSYARNSILYLAEQKVISGDQNGNFSPQKSVTRAEMVALMAKALNLDITKLPETATFKDVPLDNWAAKYVEAAYRDGIVTGVTTTEFKPNDKITREQMAVIFVRALKLKEKGTSIELNNINVFTDKLKISNWAEQEVEVAIEAGLMNGVSSKSFEPKSAANKEQSAVVIERLMKNKNDIINKFKIVVADEAAIKLIINNESVVLKNNVIVHNDKVMLPIEFLNKYVIDPNVYDIQDNESTIEIILSQEYKNLGLEKLWFKVGSNKAYKNVENDPFAGTADTNNQIDLKAVPIIIDEKTYISAEDLSTILGLNYVYDNNANKVTIYNSLNGKSANLYFALKQLAYYDYIGESRAASIIKVSNFSKEKYQIKTSETYSRQSDPYTAQFDIKDVLEQTGKQTQSLEQHTIIIGNKQYTKDPIDNKWIVSNIENEGIYYSDNLFDPMYEQGYIENVANNQVIFDNFAKLDFKNAGKVYISGIPSTKYIVELDINTIKNIMTQDEYVQVKDYFDAEFNNGIKYTYEYYVANNTVIKQAYEFSANASNDDGTPINYFTHTDIFYKNIGKQLPITAPATSQLK